MLNRSFLNLYGSLGDRAPMVAFSKLYKHTIKHQPLEAYTCLLYPSEHGSLGIDRAVEGPVSASPFPVYMVELTLCRHHHNLVNTLTLYTPVRATVSFKCHDA